MTLSRKFLLVFVLLIVAGVVGYERHIVQRQREQMRMLSEQTSAARETLDQLRRTVTRDATELKLAQDQLAQLSAAITPADETSRPGRAAEIKAWTARVRELQRLFEQRPDQRIPEMQFLTEVEWLRAARIAQLDSETAVRTALASLRTAGKTKFVEQLSAAVRKLVAASPDGKSPPTMSDLIPFFEGPIDFTLLQRYEVFANSRPARKPSAEMAALGLVSANDADWRVREIAPIDADYDTRHEALANGVIRKLTPPEAWIPGFEVRIQQAQSAYREAHKGTNARNTSDLLPYLNPPLDSAKAELIIRRERASRY